MTRRPYRVIDLTGLVVGKLTVIGQAPTEARRIRWECRCECGGTCIVAGYHLTSKRKPTTSCGCVGHKVRGSIEDRFWARVRKSDGCWEWTGARDTSGYGQLVVGGRKRRTSRLSWELHNGAIADDLEVCHRCDNPGCVRPDHLFLGTRTDNMQDALAKGRLRAGPSLPGDENPSAKLTWSQVQEARARVAQGTSRTAVAKSLGVSIKTVSNIVSGRSWRNRDERALAEEAGVATQKQLGV